MAQINQPRSTSGATVSVACKLPHGLILRNYKMEEHDEPLMGGGYHSVKRAALMPGEILINGNAHPQNAGPACPIVGGYAITHGVNKEFWDRWYAVNKDSDMVKNKLIFAHEKVESTQGQAKEQLKVRSNLERLDPENLPKGTKVKTADDTPKETLDKLKAGAEQAQT